MISRAAISACRHLSAMVCSTRADGGRQMSAIGMLDPCIGLPAEAREFFDVAKDFADRELAPHAARWDAEHTFPEAALRKAASLGFGGLYVSSAHGGAALGRETCVPIIEALAGADTSTTAYLTIHNMVAWMIDTFGTEEQRLLFLPRLVTMEHFASYCLTEPGSGSDAASLTTRAVRDGNDYLLTGSKAFISGGGRSDLYAVMARTSEDGARGISCFLVPHPSPGLAFGKQEKKLGWRSQPTCAVFLDNVRVPASQRLGSEGEGFKIAMRGLNGGRLSIAACSLGAAATCLDLSRAHIQTRKQFGQPLASQQALQFMVADMATRLVSSRLLVHHAARALDAKHEAAASLCAMAKKQATESGFAVVNDALQLHGGYGYLQDYPIERFLRDVRVHTILEGTNQVMDVILARALLA